MASDREDLSGEILRIAIVTSVLGLGLAATSVSGCVLRQRVIELEQKVERMEVHR